MFQRTAVEKDPEVEVATMLFLYCEHGRWRVASNCKQGSVDQICTTVLFIVNQISYNVLFLSYCSVWMKYDIVC